MPLYSALYYIVFFALFFLLLWSLERDKYGTVIPLVGLSVLLILFSALRFDVGRDYDVYQGAFDFAYSNHSEHLETPWKVLNEVLGYLHLDFSFWTFIVALLFVPLSLYAYKKQSYHYALAILTFVLVFKLYFESFNMVRQCMAQAVCLYALPFFRKKRYWETLFILLMAFSVHASAIVMFVMLPLFFVRYNRALMMSLLLLSITLFPIVMKAFFTSLIPFISGEMHLPLDLTYIKAMGDTQEGKGTGILYLFNTLIALYFLWRERDLLVRDKALLLYLNTFFFAIIITNTFIFFQVADRFMYYPYFFLPILVSNLYERGNRYDRWVLLAMLLVQTLITTRNILNTEETYHNYRLIIHDKDVPNDFWVQRVQEENRTYWGSPLFTAKEMNSKQM